jgi:DNA-binding MarR family transcriptional regulator
LKLEDSLGFVLNNAGRRVGQLLSIRFESYGITREQWIVLNRLAERDAISQKDLAKRVEKDQTNVTRIVDQLERKRLVERRPNVEDRRSFLVCITDEGRTVNDKLIPIEAEVIMNVLENISEEKIAEFREVLRQITENANMRIKEMER